MWLWKWYILIGSFPLQKEQQQKVLARKKEIGANGDSPTEETKE